MQERSLALAGWAEARPLQGPRSATSLLDRSIGSASGSTEKSREAKEISRKESESSTCTKLEQMRRSPRLRNSAESSQPSAWRRRWKAASKVVPLPEKGSRTKSPSLVEARRMRSRRATGFWVGCLPNFFSQDSGGRISQTDFICLPRLVSFINL